MTDKDVLVSRADIAEAFGVSLPTIDNWFKDDDFPTAKENGGQGKAYQFSLNDVRNWYEKRQLRKTEEDKQRREAIRKLQSELDLEGGEANGIDALPSKARKEYYDAEARRMSVARQRGELMESSIVEKEFEQILQTIARFLQALPDQLARDCDLKPGVVGTIQEKVDQHQEGLARMMMAKRKLADVA